MSSGSPAPTAVAASPPTPAGLAAGTGLTAGTGCRSGRFSPRFGNSLTPVIGSRRWAIASERVAQVAAIRSATSPDRRPATIPPARSISVNQAQAASASSAVSDSTYQEPPAGSVTRIRLDSSCRRVWVLRAIRREKSSGRPRRVSNGRTVTASAPPTPAPKQASVVRSMFTQGSRRVIIAAEVTACWRWARSAGSAPHTSATRDHNRRAARSFAIEEN